MKYKTAFYIGRFQPVHKAHLESIKRALETAEHLVIFVGSANRHVTIKNPWTFERRRTLIEDAIREYMNEPLHRSFEDHPSPSILDRITILPLRDYLYNDYKWASEVYAKASMVPGQENNRKSTVLFGCYKDDTSYYLDMFQDWSMEVIPYLWHLDSTDIRKDMFENGGLKKDDDRVMPSTISYINEWMRRDEFEKSLHLRDEWAHYKRYAEMWAAAPFTPTFVTTDAVVIKSGAILLIKRKVHPGKDLWALPGGFLDTTERIIDGSIRELKEETHINVTKEELKSKIKDVEVFEHPYRSLRGRSITHAHLFDLGYGPLPNIRGGDDAKEAHWVSLSDFYHMENEMFEDHYDIIINMTSKY